MKTTHSIQWALAGLIVVSMVTTVGAQPPKMKMTTEIPPGIATPDKLETRIGTLNLFDGVPDKETAQKVYDNLDFQRGVQAYLNSIQIASMYGMRKGILEFGPANTTALLFETLMDSKALWLTPNTTSVYMTSWLELKDEPMVIETPPNVLGIIDDHWFHYVADFGNAGPDKGKGGKFLILPPGYEGEVPDGYYVARTNTYGNWVIWRGFQVEWRSRPGRRDDQEDLPHLSAVAERQSAEDELHQRLRQVQQHDPPHGLTGSLRRSTRSFRPSRAKGRIRRFSACWRPSASRRASHSSPTPG